MATSGYGSRASFKHFSFFLAHNSFFRQTLTWQTNVNTKTMAEDIAQRYSTCLASQGPRDGGGGGGEVRKGKGRGRVWRETRAALVEQYLEFALSVRIW
jgi:hypothetical protein